MVDHRASPGLPADIARQIGYDPAQCREGQLFETASLTCAHCKIAVVKNPLRDRERAHCFKCDHYICDLCAERAQHPDYIHASFEKYTDAGREAAINNLGSPPKLILPS